MEVQYIANYYFRLGANYMLTPFYVTDFLLYTVISVCVFFHYGSMKCKRSK